MPQYSRTFEQLEKLASKFWPSELSKIEADLSIIPLLLKTQDQFISVIGAGAPTLERLFAIIEASDLPANLFVKHLVILADYSGEMLSRASNQFYLLFPNEKIEYVFNNQVREYKFKALPGKKLTNHSLRIDGKELLNDYPLGDLQKDAIAILLFGSIYSHDDAEIASALSKCEIGEYLGKPQELANFVKQRYIWVSRITGGAKVNTLGQIAQNFVAEYLGKNLRIQGLQIKKSGRLPNVTHTDSKTGRLTSFDIVVTDGKKYVAVEVCFQVTTNSVIERKAGQARSRYEQLNHAGHKIAYVLDGAGNFERVTALRTICSYSDCTVAFSENEFAVLCDFIREQFTDL